VIVSQRQIEMLQQQLFDAKSFADENVVAEKMRRLGLLPNIPTQSIDISLITHDVCHEFG
jgi:hypothetical protein